MLGLNIAETNAAVSVTTTTTRTCTQGSGDGFIFLWDATIPGDKYLCKEPGSTCKVTTTTTTTTTSDLTVMSTNSFALNMQFIEATAEIIATDDNIEKLIEKTGKPVQLGEVLEFPSFPANLTFPEGTIVILSDCGEYSNLERFELDISGRTLDANGKITILFTIDN